MSRTWFPLESNPDVMNSYMERLGFNSERYNFVDVLSTEDWALDMVPKPALAVLMLFPLTPVEEDHRRSESERIRTEGQHVSPDVFYMKQTIGNACGTIGLLHAVGNARQHASNLLMPDSHLERLINSTNQLEPEQIAEHLENDQTLEAVHTDAATQGQTEVVEDIDNHFVCFVHVGGHIYELDGRKEFPINHGNSSPETFLSDAVRVVQQFMSRQPEEPRFTMVALAPVSSQDE
eukprot:CAMPEP_0202964712 /NCGR_PEP_ID=MMETSP1396-20130829/8812_1 /ASSEMBLY_ACC=CAM_ASM_000872 /TAXON_ID= /ORGANISM="Pseudokeronopsis sp., Strain Brazil" /LENGTH=234 /DNA_ID=CAMNT_0049687039 /DNA_START=54 /DNA_END=758 /DNA_ORIENTATION=+